MSQSREQSPMTQKQSFHRRILSAMIKSQVAPVSQVVSPKGSATMKNSCNTSTILTKSFRFGSTVELKQSIPDVGYYLRNNDPDAAALLNKVGHIPRARQYISTRFKQNEAAAQLDTTVKDICTRVANKHFQHNLQEDLEKKKEHSLARSRVFSIANPIRTVDHFPKSLSGTDFVDRKFIITFKKRFKQSLNSYSKSYFNDVIKNYIREGDGFKIPNFKQIAPKDVNATFVARKKYFPSSHKIIQKGEQDSIDESKLDRMMESVRTNGRSSSAMRSPKSDLTYPTRSKFRPVKMYYYNEDN